MSIRMVFSSIKKPDELIFCRLSPDREEENEKSELQNSNHEKASVPKVAHLSEKGDC
jgi:hypothetical protein